MLTLKFNTLKELTELTRKNKYLGKYIALSDILKASDLTPENLQALADAVKQNRYMLFKTELDKDLGTYAYDIQKFITFFNLCGKRNLLSQYSNIRNVFVACIIFFPTSLYIFLVTRLLELSLDRFYNFISTPSSSFKSFKFNIKEFRNYSSVTGHYNWIFENAYFTNLFENKDYEVNLLGLVLFPFYFLLKQSLILIAILVALPVFLALLIPLLIFFITAVKYNYDIYERNCAELKNCNQEIDTYDHRATKQIVLEDLLKIINENSLVAVRTWAKCGKKVTKQDIGLDIQKLILKSMVSHVIEVLKIKYTRKPSFEDYHSIIISSKLNKNFQITPDEFAQLIQEDDINKIIDNLFAPNNIHNSAVASPQTPPKSLPPSAKSKWGFFSKADKTEKENLYKNPETDTCYILW